MVVGTGSRLKFAPGGKGNEPALGAGMAAKSGSTCVCVLHTD